MLIKIKNRSLHPVLLKSKAGDVIQINAGVVKEIDENFLVNYDTKAIQLLSKKPIQTVISDSSIVPTTTEETIDTPKTSRSRKSSTVITEFV